MVINMKNYEKLKKLQNQIDTLLDANTTSSSHVFKSWHAECIRFITNYYGKSSVELENFKKIKFQCAIIDNTQQRIWCKEGLMEAKSMFTNLLEDIGTDEETSTEVVSTNETKGGNKVFIVHGHDSELKYKTSNLLRKLGLNPIILHEQVNTSRTIIEKIEECGSEAQAAIILFTPDDIGKAKTEEEEKKRGRQNVVFEAGYFMGLLGRRKTMLIVSDDKIELPGDLSGVVYSGESNEFDIAKELKAMGLQIDMNGLLS